MMRKSVLILATLFAIALSEDKAPNCDKGCAVCNTANDYCLICYGMGVIAGKCAAVGMCAAASWNGSKMRCFGCLKPEEQVFKKDRSDCEAVITKIANCLSYSSQTECDKCAKNYLLSADGSKCDAITLVANCSYYLSTTQCGLCKDNFYLDGNVCKAGTVIDCISASALDKCRGCIAGKSLTVATKDTCDAVTKAIDNCEYYTAQKCTKCKTGYTADATGATCVVIPAGCVDKDCTVCDVPIYYADYYYSKQICVPTSPTTSTTSTPSSTSPLTTSTLLTSSTSSTASNSSTSSMDILGATIVALLSLSVFFNL